MTLRKSSSASWAVGGGILASAAYFILRIVVGTFRYLDFLRERAVRYSDARYSQLNRAYPTTSVVVYSLLILLEAFVFWVVLAQVRTALWRRTLICGLGALVAALAVAGGLHSPPAVDYHALWLFWISATMLVTTIVAGVMRFVQWRRSLIPS